MDMVKIIIKKDSHLRVFKNAPAGLPKSLQGDWEQDHMPEILKKSHGKPQILLRAYARNIEMCSESQAVVI